MLDKINNEMKMWEDYYNGMDDIALAKIKDEILSDSSLSDSDKESAIEDINTTKDKVKFECFVAIRTLTWVKEIMAEDNKTTEDDE